MRTPSVWAGSAAIALAAGAALATRRSLKALDKADAEHPVPEFRFPAGQVHHVETADGGSIAVEVTGDTDGKQAVVVLVHGIVSNRHHWGPVAQLLVDQGCTVVGIDQRGHGDSTLGSSGCETNRLGLDIHRVLEHLDLNNVILVGHSMGGMAAMSYGVDQDSSFTERVGGLVLVATAARASMAYQRFGLGLLSPLLGIADREMPIFRPIASQSMFGRFGSTQLLEAARLSVGDVDLAAMKECARALGSFDISDQLGRIKVPTRLIYGSRDTVTPPFENRRIGQSIEGTLVTEVSGAGHLFIWTHARDISEQILGLRSELSAAI